MKGIVVDIQRFSVHDGPGIRTVVFFKGCPLNCLWCQNPESIDPKPLLGYWENRCVDDGSCVKVCPEGAIKLFPRRIIRKKCKAPEGCTICVDACPSGALDVAGHALTIEEILKVVEEDLTFYEESKGGVTCSGGEPTYQWSFVKEFLIKCKERKISTAIETCGFFNPSIIEDLYKLNDTILIDIKHLDDKIHKNLTGQSNTRILENIKSLIEKQRSLNEKKLIIRIPLIPKLNDSKEHLEKLELFLLNLGINKLILLPYHTLYLQKIDNFRLKKKKLKIKPYNKSELENIKSYFKEIEISIGG